MPSGVQPAGAMLDSPVSDQSVRFHLFLCFMIWFQYTFFTPVLAGSLRHTSLKLRKGMLFGKWRGRRKKVLVQIKNRTCDWLESGGLWILPVIEPEVLYKPRHCYDSLHGKSSPSSLACLSVLRTAVCWNRNPISLSVCRNSECLPRQNNKC